MNWVVQFDKEFIQKLGRKEMKRYGMTIKYSGTVYVEVDVPNGEDPEEYALSEAEGYFTKICDWESEVVDVSEVDPND